MVLNSWGWNRQLSRKKALETLQSVFSACSVSDQRRTREQGRRFSDEQYNRGEQQGGEKSVGAESRAGAVSSEEKSARLMREAELAR